MGLLKTAAKVGVASSVHGRVQRRQQQRWAEQDAAVASSPAAGPAAAPASSDPKVALIGALTELRAAGILSDDEFAAMSARVFAR